MCNYRYPDFLTQEQELERRKRDLKLHLNSLYEQLVYADTDSIYTKENNMRKEFIVLHDDCEDGAVFILRKSAIVSVSKEMFGGETFCYVRTENVSFRVTESYAEVVKRLFE